MDKAQINSCPICNKAFASRANLLYHTENNACKMVNKFNCPYCESSYTTKRSMNRHIKENCKEKKRHDMMDEDTAEKEKIYMDLLFKLQQDNERITNEYTQLKKDVDVLKGENCQLKQELSSNKSSGTVNNSVNVNNGTVNNFYLSGYGKEDMSKIDQKDLLKGFKNGFNSTLTLIDSIHFNPKYPEFHNIYISSMKNQYAMMYDGTDWTLVMKDDLIDRLYNNKRDYIEENLDEFIGSLSKSQLSALYRWLDVDDNHSYVKKIKNDIKLLLYNKRSMVIHNVGLIEYNARLNANKTNNLDMNSDEINKDIINKDMNVETIDDENTHTSKDKSNMKVIKEPKVHIRYDLDSDSDFDSFDSIDRQIMIRRREKSFAQRAGRPGTKRKSRKISSPHDNTIMTT